MNQIGNGCLILTGILCFAWFAMFSHRHRISTAILVSLTVYVIGGLSSIVVNPAQLQQGKILNDVDRAELSLRFYTAWGNSLPKSSISWYRSIRPQIREVKVGSTNQL